MLSESEAATSALMHAARVSPRVEECHATQTGGEVLGCFPADSCVCVFVNCFLVVVVDVVVLLVLVCVSDNDRVDFKVSRKINVYCLAPPPC